MKRMTKVLIGTGAGLALVAGVAVATPAIAATVAPRDGAIGCGWPGHVWSRLPADLRDAREAPAGAERRAAFEAIRDRALDGEYGDRVERFAEAHPGFGVHAWRDAPEALRDDVRAALELDGDERAAAFEEIDRKAVAGEYGDAVQERAEQARNAPWWPDCAR